VRGGTRLFVERAVYDEVVSRYGALASALKVGPALIPPRSLARWCRRASMNAWQTIWRLARRKGRGLSAARGRPARRARSGLTWPPPSLPTCATRCASRARRSSALSPILPFDSFDEVITRANATRFGLAGGVWTRNIDKAMAAVKRIRAGSIWVNHYFAMDPGVPFGGYKMSGFGEGGFEHIDAYLQTKGVWIRTGPGSCPRLKGRLSRAFW
jgi:aldehyde dehydrogenase (NAD+)